MTGFRRFLLTSITMVAFAANSVLCRLALGREFIDPMTFTTVRLVSGAVCLGLIVVVKERHLPIGPPRVLSVIALFLYMVLFSFAYVALATGTGALLLFGFVQLTMITAGLLHGDRMPILSWFGLTIAALGVIYLVSPGMRAPDLQHALMMALAGIAWGTYSLRGKGAINPTVVTASNFLYAAPLALLASLCLADSAWFSWPGLMLAVVSGAVTSGVGYAIWYLTLRYITATSAAVVQLSVPAIATLGGVLFMAEPLDTRITLATAMTLGGIALVLRGYPVKR